MDTSCEMLVGRSAVVFVEEIRLISTSIKHSRATHLDARLGLVSVIRTWKHEPACVSQWNKPASSLCIMRRCISTIAPWRRPSRWMLIFAPAKRIPGEVPAVKADACIYADGTGDTSRNRVIRFTSDSQTLVSLCVSLVCCVSYARRLFLARSLFSRARQVAAGYARCWKIFKFPVDGKRWGKYK